MPVSPPQLMTDTMPAPPINSTVTCSGLTQNSCFTIAKKPIPTLLAIQLSHNHKHLNLTCMLCLHFAGITCSPILIVSPCSSHDWRPPPLETVPTARAGMGQKKTVSFQPASSTNAEEPLGKMNKTKPGKLGPTRLLTRKAFGQVEEETNTESVLHTAASFAPQSKFLPPETEVTPSPSMGPCVKPSEMPMGRPA